MSNSELVRRGLPGEAETLDPQLADDTFSLPVVRDLYEGLTSEDRSGHVTAGVAMNWTMDKSGTTYTFHLRPDARWSNGDTVTASEFVQGLRRALDPHTASGAAAVLSVIKGASDVIAGRKTPDQLAVRAPDKATVEIDLEQPAPFILQILSEPIGAPLHRNNPSTANPNVQNPIVNGAYTLSQHVLGSYIDLQKNKYYWNATSVTVDRIRYSTQQSESVELNRYLAGDLDLTSTIPTPDLERVKKDHSAEVQSSPYLGTVYLALNLANAPLAHNADLRKALSLVIDRDVIAERVIVGVNPAYNFVAAGTTGYAAATYPWSLWSRDQRWALAQRLYSSAGYSLQNPLHLRVFYNSGEGIQRTIIALTENWRQALGIVVQPQSMEFRAFLSEKNNRSNWDVLRTAWVADFDDPSSFLNVFSQFSAQNDPGYRDKSFDLALKAAENELDPDRRMARFRDAEQLLLDSYAIIPLYFYTQRRLVNPKLGGAELTPLNHSRSQFLYWKK